MSDLERTHIHNKLKDLLYQAWGADNDHELYLECKTLLEILIRDAQTLEDYRKKYPKLKIVDRREPGQEPVNNWVEVTPPGVNRVTRQEAIDIYFKLRADGFGSHFRFRVYYAYGAHIDFLESEENNVIPNLLADYSINWRVFRNTENHTVNLILKEAIATEDAQTLAESMATRIKEQYPYEVIVVRVPTLDGSEVRIAKR